MTHPNHSSAHRVKSRKGEKPGWHSYRQALDLLRQQEWNGALRLLAEAEVVFRTTNDVDGQWRALAAQAEIHMHEGMAPQAMARALAAMAIVEHLDDPRTCGLLAWRIALIALHQGDYRTGSAYLQRAQFCLDMADAAPPGGILASAAQICAEIARWQQVILQGRMTVDEGEAIINEARAELMRCLLDIHRALTSRDLAPPESWAWVHTGLLLPASANVDRRAAAITGAALPGMVAGALRFAFPPATPGGHRADQRRRNVCRGCDARSCGAC
jgi:hypothetical protein